MDETKIGTRIKRFSNGRINLIFSCISKKGKPYNLGVKFKDAKELDMSTSLIGAIVRAVYHAWLEK